MRTVPILALALSGCVIHVNSAEAWDSVRGDGNKVTQSRALAGFDRIELRTHLDVEVAEGPPHAVSVTIDENLQPLVTTSVRGTTLIIDSTRGVSFRGPGKVVVSLPELGGFVIEGSGDAHIAGADRPRDVELRIEGSGDLRWSGRARALKVRISGSGDVSATGSAESLDASIDGSGDVRARELTARNARLAISGSGEVAATLDGGALSAAIEGSGDIVWYGKAQVESAAVSGSGSIKHR